jgi:plasmid stability protein
MATLVILDLDDQLVARLRSRAAEHGGVDGSRARAILAASVSRRPTRQLGSHIRGQFAELHGVELDLPARSRD